MRKLSINSNIMHLSTGIRCIEKRSSSSSSSSPPPPPPSARRQGHGTEMNTGTHTRSAQCTVHGAHWHTHTARTNYRQRQMMCLSTRSEQQLSALALPLMSIVSLLIICLHCAQHLIALCIFHHLFMILSDWPYIHTHTYTLSSSLSLSLSLSLHLPFPSNERR